MATKARSVEGNDHTGEEGVRRRDFLNVAAVSFAGVGTVAALAPLIAKWLPARIAKIDVAEAGETITVTVANAGRVKSQRLRDPQGQGFTLRGGGFVTGLGMQEVDLAPSGSRWTDPDLREFETKSGARGEFNWSG